MHYAALISALAASAIAAPAALVKKAERATLEPAPLCERFSVAFKVEGSYVSANAVKNGSTILLQAERLSVYPGTPAYFNSSNPNPDQFNYGSLNFIVDDVVYGANAADVGDAYGVHVPIFLEPNYQQFEWSVGNGTFYHKLAAAPNNFYACNGTLEDGTSNIFLSWGDERYSPVAGPPEGCYYTQVIQNFNIEGGAKPSN